MKLRSKKVAILLSLTMLASGFAIARPYAEEAIVGDASSVLEENISATSSDAATASEAELATPAIAFYAAAGVTYPAKITFVNIENQERTVDFADGNEEIGFQNIYAGGFSDWSYRTGKKVVIGWSDVQNYRGSTSDNIFMTNTSVEEILNTLGPNPRLYEARVGVEDAIDLGSVIRSSDGRVYINKKFMGEDTVDVPSNFIRDHEGYDNDTDNKITTVYYKQDQNNYRVTLNSNFNFNNNIIPSIVAQNPLTILKSAQGINDFSGRSPRAYTYVDLKVKLDPRVDVAAYFKDVTFRSALFMVSAVLDENYVPLAATIDAPENGEMETKFSFQNPDKKKTFIIRTTLRNYGGSYGNNPTENPYATLRTASNEEVFGDMILSSGDAGNITVPKNLALELANNEPDRLVFTGEIQGRINFDTSKIPFPYNFFAPNTAEIQRIASVNSAYIGFSLNRVTFDKNSNTRYGDTSVQDLGTVKVVHTNNIDSDDLTDESMPDNPAPFTDASGNLLRFKGWNTQADGSGEFFTGSYVVNEDMIVYAIWGTDEPPVIITRNITVCINENVNLASLATASDPEDGDITSRILVKEIRTPSGDIVSEANFKTDTAGDYIVTYRVVDSDGNIAENSAVITVKTGEKPVITTTDVTVKINEPVNLRNLATAKDFEDGDLTAKLIITQVRTPSGNIVGERDFNTGTEGVYTITYEVTDSCGNMTSNTATVTVLAANGPVITTTDITVPRYDYVNIRDLAKASDPEDGDITSKIDIVSIMTPSGKTVTEGEFNTNLIGDYIITYTVKDADGNTAKNTATVTVYNPSNGGGSGGSSGGGSVVPRPINPTSPIIPPSTKPGNTITITDEKKDDNKVAGPVTEIKPVSEAKNSVTGIPKTSDENSVAVWVFGAVMAALGIVIFSKKRKSDK